MEHFHKGHARDTSGRFSVFLSIKSDAPLLEDSRSQVVRRFKLLEHSLRAKCQFDQFSVAVNEYFVMGHAEAVPTMELNKVSTDVLYHVPLVSLVGLGVQAN